MLGYWEWRDALERGIAAHHAGLLPVFKETVEELFVAGLVKAVFATETLALGINMPARTVVLEKLSKYNGEGHADLTAGEYTQLTGRAGRRGIDIEGHAVVVWSPGMDPRAVGGLASRRTYPLRSSFRPSYNMAVNLVGPARPGRRPGICSSSRSRSTRPTPRWSGWPGRSSRNAEAIASHASGDAVPSRRHRVLPGAARPIWPPPRRRSPGPGRPGGATRRPAIWRSCAAAT